MCLPAAQRGVVSDQQVCLHTKSCFISCVHGHVRRRRERAQRFHPAIVFISVCTRRACGRRTRPNTDRYTCPYPGISHAGGAPLTSGQPFPSMRPTFLCACSLFSVRQAVGGSVTRVWRRGSARTRTVRRHQVDVMVWSASRPHSPISLARETPGCRVEKRLGTTAHA